MKRGLTKEEKDSISKLGGQQGSVHHLKSARCWYVEPCLLGAAGVVGTFITNHHKLFVNFRFIIVQVLVTSLEKVHKDGNI